MTQDRRAPQQCRAGAGGECRRHLDIADDIGHAAGVDDPDHHLFFDLLEAGEVSLSTDDRKRVAVDLGAIANIVLRFSHGLRPSTEAKIAPGSATSSANDALPAGRSCAVPLRTIPYLPSAPTSTRSAPADFAQPLAQPET